MTKTIKNILLLLALGVIGVVGYFVVFSSDSSDIVTVGGTGNQSQAAFQTREFKNILDELNTINIDASILQDEDFLQLVDHTQTVSERSYGRANPFVNN